MSKRAYGRQYDSLEGYVAVWKVVWLSGSVAVWLGYVAVWLGSVAVWLGNVAVWLGNVAVWLGSEARIWDLGAGI